MTIDEMVEAQLDSDAMLRQANPILKCGYCGKIGEEFPTNDRAQTFDHIQCIHCGAAKAEATNMYKELGL